VRTYSGGLIRFHEHRRTYDTTRAGLPQRYRTASTIVKAGTYLSRRSPVDRTLPLSSCLVGDKPLHRRVCEAPCGHSVAKTVLLSRRRPPHRVSDEPASLRFRQETSPVDVTVLCEIRNLSLPVLASRNGGSSACNVASKNDDSRFGYNQRGSATACTD
jgi:hypothetical protein